MSSQVPESEALKIKYKEIAALKKAIQEKQELKRQQQQNASKIQKQAYKRILKLPVNPNVFLQQKPKFSNMTLVVNNTGGSTNGTTSTTKEGTSSTDQQGYVSVQSSGGKSFYNINVYQQEAEKLKAKILLKKKQVQEQKRLEKIRNQIPKFRTMSDNCDRIKINGDKYAVTENGRALVPIRMFQLTNPIECIWNGNKYQRNSQGVFKLSTPVRRKRKNTELCRYFTRTGMCDKGINCKYDHDKEKIRICPLFLLGKCYSKNCLLSHSPNDNNTPQCRYFLDKSCQNPNCKYRHFKPAHYNDPNYEIWTCRPFAIGGFCLRGKKCPFLHLLNCPDFEEDNYCVMGRECPLTHQFTLKTQDLIATKSNKYIRDETVVTEESMPTPVKTIVNSYTVDPKLLFVVDETGNYQFYIDEIGRAHV